MNVATPIKAILVLSFTVCLLCADGVSASQENKKLGYAERGSPLLGLPESGTEVGVLELARGGGVAQRQALSF